MNKKNWVKSKLQFITSLILIFFLASCDRYPEYIFPGVKGPAGSSLVSKEKMEHWQDYQKGETSRLAIWLTEEEGSNWLGMANGLKTIGLPFIITNNLDEALQHRVVAIYPSFSNKHRGGNARNKLQTFVTEGGTLIGFKEFEPLKEVFGLDHFVSAKRKTMTFLDGLPFDAPLPDPADNTIIINTSLDEDASDLTRTREYYPAGASVVAQYENQTAAITTNQFGKGKAIGIGVDIGFFTSKSYGMHQNISNERYANHFTPSVEALLFYLARVYQQNEPNAILLKTTPHRKKLAVLFSHDIDWGSSLKNSLEYAQYEKSQEVKGTYFIEVKYVTNAYDRYFFDESAIPILRQIRDLGMEIASHSIAHSHVFASFPLGEGDEEYPAYKPINVSLTETKNGTIFGELRVSKFLLETCIEAIEVQSFRPGYLARPPRLPELLEATKYLFSSSVTANNAYTHLPFPLYYSDNYQSNVNIFEFPISLEDLVPPKMGDRIPEGIALGKKLSTYGACCMILIHPDVLDHKFEFQKQFTEAFKEDAWFPSLIEYGSWWTARQAIEVDVKDLGQRKQVVIESPRPIQGLNLAIPEGWKFIGSNPSTLQVSQGNKDCVINELAGHVELLFE